jgi:hypothetical protein
MKPGVPSVAALVTATTISVIAGSSPTVDRRSTPQVPAQPTPVERLESSVTTVRSGLIAARARPSRLQTRPVPSTVSSHV